MNIVLVCVSAETSYFYAFLMALGKEVIILHACALNHHHISGKISFSFLHVKIVTEKIIIELPLVQTFHRNFCSHDIK